jgi:dethiobiotin synthetase
VNPLQELELKMLQPPRGSVLEIKVAFPGSPKTYTYVAVEAVGGWYLTNMRSDPAMNWEGLIDWFKSKDAEVVSVRRATEWVTL